MEGVGVGILRWAEGQVMAKFEEKVAWLGALVALVKQRVEAISLETAISDLALEVS